MNDVTQAEEMVGLLSRTERALKIFTGHDSYPNLKHHYGDDWWTPLNKLRDELRDKRTAIEADLAAALREVMAAGTEAHSANDIRALGWTVAVHNDYRLNGQPHTFWLFTKNGQAIKGEGRTDTEALDAVRRQISAA